MHMYVPCYWSLFWVTKMPTTYIRTYDVPNLGQVCSQYVNLHEAILDVVNR